MLIVGYKPAKGLEGKYSKKGYSFRWAKIARLPTWERLGFEVAHRKHRGEVTPIEYADMILVGTRV
jgi:hypothetical protein